jgi:hypothetical protein
LDWALAGDVAFESPDWLRGLWALPLIVVFYLLRRRARRVPVPFLPFWERVFADRRRKPTLVRTLVSILLQMLTAAAILVALAGPCRDEWRAEPTPTVVVVDLSLGTRTTAGGRTLAEITVARAREVVARAAPEGPLAIAALRAGMEPLGHAASVAEAQTLLDRAPPPSGTRSLDALLALHAASRAGGRIVFVTPFAEGTTGLDAVTVVASAPGPLTNGGIRRVTFASKDGRLEATVDAAGLAREARLVDALGSVLALAAVPAEGGTVTLAVPPSCPSEVAIELAPKDGFPEDDVALLALPGRGGLRVAVASDRPTPALDAALLASAVMDEGRSGRVPLARLADVAAAFDVVVVAAAGTDVTLPEGRYFLAGALPVGAPIAAKGGMGEARAVRKSDSVPWLAALDVDEWRVHRMPRLEAGEGLEVLVDGTRGPLLARFRQRGADGFVLAVAPDLDASTLPLLPVFPLMLRGALLELAPRAAASGPVVHRAGGRVVMTPDEAAAVIDAGGAPRPLRPARDGGGFELPEEPGRFAGGTRRIATAWLDHPALPGAARTRDDPWPEVARTRSRTSFRPEVLLALLVLLAAEWCSYHGGATD